MVKVKGAKERLHKAGKIQKTALAMVKKIETGRLTAKARSRRKERAQKKEKRLAKEDSLVTAKATLDADNLRRQEISSAYAMKVQVLKMKTKDLEKQALQAQRRANRKARHARDAATTVLKLQKRARRHRRSAIKRIIKSNKKANKSFRMRQVEYKAKAKTEAKPKSKAKAKAKSKNGGSKGGF